jgi:hypothetical protein
VQLKTCFLYVVRLREHKDSDLPQYIAGSHSLLLLELAHSTCCAAVVQSSLSSKHKLAAACLSACMHAGPAVVQLGRRLQPNLHPDPASGCIKRPTQEVRSTTAPVVQIEDNMCWPMICIDQVCRNTPYDMLGQAAGPVTQATCCFATALQGRACLDAISPSPASSCAAAAVSWRPQHC